MKNSKFLGGLLLIMGTSIGGGMLALPVATAELGFTNACLFLLCCWLLMTAGALLMLEVNAKLPKGSNIISMAQKTLGAPGTIVAWLSYLTLLYTLLAAYISGGSDVLDGILQSMHIKIPQAVLAIGFTVVFGLIVYHGMRTVDYVNRGLMFGKLFVFLSLVFLIAPHVQTHNISGGHIEAIGGCLMILITSFGFASIVPSLRDYFDDDIGSLRKVILLGSLIPLLCYTVWIFVVAGVVGKEGELGLISLMHSDHATSGLTKALYQNLQTSWIADFFGLFTSICMLTAFLGVSIGLFDFLADGLKLSKQGVQGKTTLSLTFLPPLAIVLIKPGIYLNALAYAGVCCVLLLLVLPSLMTLRAQKTTGHSGAQTLVAGSNITAVLVFTIALILLAINVIYP